MNRTVYIEFYKQVDKLILYTLRFEGESESETDAFFARFKGDSQYIEDVQIIVRVLQNFGRRGVEDRYLRPEENASALPVDASNLRLYCIKGHKYCLILGGGGIKTSQRVQDSPDVFPHFKRIIAIEKAFRDAIQERDIYWDDDELAGELELTIDL